MSRPGAAALAAPWLLATTLLATMLLAAGCASAPAPAPAGAETPGRADLGAPWSLPAVELATQRLFRVSYDGPDEGGSFRLTLSLLTPDRYQVRAADPLGRALWTLDVAGGEGLWLDHRNRLVCRLEGRFDLAAARLTPFPLPALPALLLGRLPAPPDGAVERLPAGGPGGADRIDYRDAAGRRWTARLEAGRPVSWALWEDGEAAVWWQRRDGEAFLSDRARGSQLRWRETLREPLPAAAGGLAAPPVPDGYRAVDCAAAYAG